MRKPRTDLKAKRYFSLWRDGSWYVQLKIEIGRYGYALKGGPDLKKLRVAHDWLGRVIEYIERLDTPK